MTQISGRLETSVVPQRVVAFSQFVVHDRIIYRLREARAKRRCGDGQDGAERRALPARSQEQKFREGVW